ncbi:MAG TPA: hypothetical protein VHJ78_00405 [Actinomycetota bacterium]|nr:hypothetical protein [Actinomycetota bacterium]
MSWLLPAVVALLAALGIREPVLRRRIPRLEIDNYRGRRVLVGGGIVIAGALAAAAIAAVAAGLAGSRRFVPDPGNRTLLGTLVLAFGFFGLGFLDDYAGDGRSKGFKGHLTALMRGEVTTGAVKAFGGMGLAFAVALWWNDLHLPAAVLDGLLIALAANFLNLLDLRPGRAAKVYLLLWIFVAAGAAGSAYLPAGAAVTAAALAWLPADLGERGTLGDSGANLLGAVLGAGMVAGFGVAATGAVLGVLVLLTLASERVSFTKLIDRTAPLRWLDGLGRSRTG